MTEFVISVLLTVAPSLYPKVEDWLIAESDTPAADVVRLRFPHDLAKDHSRGPTAPTVLVVPSSPFPVPLERWEPEWPRINGRPHDVVCHDVHRLAVVAGCTIVQHRSGGFSVYSQFGSGRVSIDFNTLEEVNNQLIPHGITLVSDADFRTFEELADERDRRKVTRCWTMLASIAVGWAAVVVAVMWRRR